MKVLFANKFFFLNGGSETVFFQERNFFINNGYSVVDFSMENGKNISSPFTDFFVPNITYKNNIGLIYKIQKAVSLIHSNRATKNIRSLIVQENPNIAHLHNIYHQLTPSIIPILKKHGLKIILTLHDYKLVCPSYLSLKNKKICEECKGQYFWKPFTTNCQYSYGKGLLLSIEAIFHKWKGSYEDVDIFLAPSQFMADQISQRIPVKKIIVLHNGIDTKEYQSSGRDLAYGIYFGRISKEKGIETLLKANNHIANPFPLKIVGTGPLLNVLREKYPSADFLGYKSGQELHTLVANAAFVVVPSEWYENCSMVVLESMALGKATIGSRIGGIPEQIEDGRTGFLFEMGNVEELSEKMALLASDEGLRRRFGKNARKKLEAEYSLSEHCRKLEKIYKNLLN